ncbi:MAG TPA: hypothetical protein VIU13_20695 [Chryseolinea sp.]
MVKRAFGFTTLLLSTIAIIAHDHHKAILAVHKRPFFDTSMYEKHILEVDFYVSFDKVTSLPKNVPLFDDKTFNTLNFQPGLKYNF